MDWDWKLVSAGMWFCAFGCAVRDDCIFGIKSFEEFASWTARPWRKSHHSHSKREFHTQRHGATCQKICILSTAVRTWECWMWLRKCFLFILIVLRTHCRCRGSLLHLTTLNDTLTHILGRTPLDEGSARRRDLYLTKHNTPKRQSSIPSAGFEPTIPAREGPPDPRLRPHGHWDRPIKVEGTSQARSELIQ